MKFFGSLYCAIILIATTILYVVAGTFLESWSGSHLFAAQLTYQNPIFQILLWGYFVNILFAALNRFPFKQKHIPFLVTHLGLLLLLLGVFVKNHFGVQGNMALKEGSGSSLIYLANSYALHVENPEGYSLIELKKAKIGHLLGKEGLHLKVLEWIPHVEERYEGFIKGKWGHILGYPPFEIKNLNSPASLITENYAIYGIQTDSLDSITFPGHSSLFFIQDSKKKEHLIAFNQHAERFTYSNSSSYFIYNKGYGGYALFAELPENFPHIELIAPLSRTFMQLPLCKKREELVPCIRLFAKAQKQAEIVTLCYDKYGQKFKWPILNGAYLLRFQSAQRKIPYHIRLRAAKQVNYPGTNKPYSYEAEILVDDEAASLSMNKVYEKKGYRFYLANLTETPSGIKQVQLVVNYDPAKYLLTYPGAILLAVGILLLYFKNRYV